jgi:hypothetical protein
MKKKTIVHVVLSTVLLLPVAVILENSDGLETISTFQEYLKEWIAPVFLSITVSALIYGMMSLMKKTPSFPNIYYYTAYTFSILILLIVSLRYL